MSRFEFTKKQKVAMLMRSKGVCEAGHEGTENFYGMRKGEICLSKAKEFDHVIADALKRERPRSADEGLHVCIVHHKNKTHKNDRPKIAKANRIRNSSYGVHKPKGKIKSHGFNRSESNTKTIDRGPWND